MSVRQKKSWFMVLGGVVLGAATFAVCPDWLWAAPSAAVVSHRRAVEQGIDFLRSRQLQDGSFSPESGPGITALAVTALLRNGVSVDDPAVTKGTDYLKTMIRPDGGIHRLDSRYRNYETCLAVMCFAEANRDGRYDKVLENADRFLKSIQWGIADPLESSDAAYGGAGYGKHKRPDLSNTAFLIEALRTLGNDENSESIQMALVFVSRCQNLPTEHNQTPFAAKVDDGGFYYTAAAGGTSQAGETADGGLRSYASMTYAGLKSMLFAGLTPDDDRVKAALAWIRKHYDLTQNPGMRDAGLYYYYHTFAKALSVAGISQIVDSKKAVHDWRADLNGELIQRQQKDGSWTNANPRWLEGNADLVTGYALLALSYTAPQ